MPNRSHRKRTRYDRKQELINKSRRKKSSTGVSIVKIKLLLRDGSNCAYCGCEKDADQLEIEHLIPKSKGGSNMDANLVLSCKPCNLKKAANMPNEIEDDILSERVEYLIYRNKNIS